MKGKSGPSPGTIADEPGGETMLNAPQPSGAPKIDNTSGPKPPTRRPGVEKAAFRLPDPVADVPATPPPDSLLALDRAARVATDLRDRKLSVHFETQPDGRVQVKVVDVGGKVLAQIPVAHALDLLSGDGPSTIFDELA
jgi:hypothetical protein